jgi:hypothetical protein
MPRHHDEECIGAEHTRFKTELSRRAGRRPNKPEHKKLQKSDMLGPELLDSIDSSEEERVD